MKNKNYILPLLTAVTCLTLAQTIFAATEEQIDRTVYSLKIINKTKLPMTVFAYSGNFNVQTNSIVVPANGEITTNFETGGYSKEKQIGIGIENMGIWPISKQENTNQARFDNNVASLNKDQKVVLNVDSTIFALNMKIEASDSTSPDKGKYRRTFTITFSGCVFNITPTGKQKNTKFSNENCPYVP